MELTSENVRTILLDCLFVNDEPVTKYVVGNGVKSKMGFHSGRLASHKEKIASLADQLPDAFKKGKGGGQSFLNACVRQDGMQWGQHTNVDELICLGSAIEKISFTFPREMWTTLPGGMPYITVH